MTSFTVSVEGHRHLFEGISKKWGKGRLFSVIKNFVGTDTHGITLTVMLWQITSFASSLLSPNLFTVIKTLIRHRLNLKHSRTQFTCDSQNTSPKIKYP